MLVDGRLEESADDRSERMTSYHTKDLVFDLTHKVATPLDQLVVTARIGAFCNRTERP